MASKPWNVICCKTGLCTQRHTGGQSAHCASLGSVTVAAVSLRLHSWGKERREPSEMFFWAPPDMPPACYFHFYMSTNLKRKPALCHRKVFLSSPILKVTLAATLATPNAAYAANAVKMREKSNFLSEQTLDVFYPEIQISRNVIVRFGHD